MDSVTQLAAVAIVATSIWVWIDFAALSKKYGEGTFAAFLWFIGCLALWIVFFPWYLVHRRDYLPKQ